MRSYKFITYLGGFIGSSVGWWIGSPFGKFAAFITSVIAMAAGIYYGRRIAQHYLG